MVGMQANSGKGQMWTLMNRVLTSVLLPAIHFHVIAPELVVGRWARGL